MPYKIDEIERLSDELSSAKYMTAEERKQILDHLLSQGWQRGGGSKVSRRGPMNVTELAIVDPEAWNSRAIAAFNPETNTIRFGPEAITPEGINPRSERHERFHAAQFALRGSLWDTLPETWRKHLSNLGRRYLYEDPHTIVNLAVGGVHKLPVGVLPGDSELKRLVSKIVNWYLTPVRYLNAPGHTVVMEGNIDPQVLRYFLSREPLPHYGIYMEIQ